MTTTTPDGRTTTRSVAEFEAYVESVFRRQNQASLETAFLLEDELDAGTRQALEQAEQQMLKACKALNRIVNRKIEGRDSDLSLELEVKDSVGACDFAASRLEQLLQTRN